MLGGVLLLELLEELHRAVARVLGLGEESVLDEELDEELVVVEVLNDLVTLNKSLSLQLRTCTYKLHFLVREDGLKALFAVLEGLLVLWLHRSGCGGGLRSL